jgi:hypothetical protein
MNKNILISIIAIFLFVWTLWDYINLEKPLNQKEQYIQDCIQASNFLSSQPINKAREVCKCELDNVEQLHSLESLDSLQHANEDSLIKIISPIMKPCIEQLIEEDKFIKSCLKTSSTLAQLPNEQGTEICLCAFENIRTSYEMEALDSLKIANEDSLNKLLLPIITKCLEPIIDQP